MDTTWTLPDGAVVRPARGEDLDALYALVADRGVPEDAIDLRLVVEGDEAGIEGTALVEQDGQVVATATLLEENVLVGDAELEVGQVELVATRIDYEHRGYIRALMQWCHARSDDLGQVAQVMIGIPYFYRRFGYVYAIPMHPYAALDAAVQCPETIDVRFATESDIPEMAGLQERAQERFDLSMSHRDETWRWLLEREGTHQWVATRRHEFVGCARTTPIDSDEPMIVAEIASVDAEATAAMLATARGPDGERDVTVEVRPHVPGLGALLAPPQRADWYYVRVADPAALLAALRPELERRLARSEFADADRLVELSFWESQLAFPIANARVGPISTGGPRQIIVSQGGSGLPPDAFPHLALGCGADGLEDRFPDAYLGDQADLMRVLFPPLSADLLTFYLAG